MGYVINDIYSIKHDLLRALFLDFYCLVYFLIILIPPPLVTQDHTEAKFQPIEEWLDNLELSHLAAIFQKHGFHDTSLLKVIISFCYSCGLLHIKHDLESSKKIPFTLILVSINESANRDHDQPKKVLYSLTQLFHCVYQIF